MRPVINSIAQANRVGAILLISSLKIKYSLSYMAQTTALRIFGPYISLWDPWQTIKLTKLLVHDFVLIIHPYFNCIEYEIWIYILQQYIFLIIKKFFGFHWHWLRSNTKLFDYIHPKTGHNSYDCSRGVLVKKYWIVRPEIDNIA